MINKSLRADVSLIHHVPGCHVSALNGFLNVSLIPGLLVVKCVIKPNPLVVLFGVLPEEPQLPAVKHTALDFGSLFWQQEHMPV